MKKTFILIAIIFATLSQFASADEYICRGSETTMKFTDVDGQDEPNFVYVRVWDAQSEGARYADLYSEMVNRRTPDVSSITSLKSLSNKSKVNDSSLIVDFKGKTLLLKTDNGFTIKDSFNCKLEKRPLASFNSIGG